MTVRQKGRLRSRVRYNLPLCLLALPAVVYVLLFNYLPMFGVVIAFMDFNPFDMFRSEWVGWENFRYIFESNDIFRVIRNTLLYNLVFIFLRQFLSVLVALGLYEITSRKALKLYQTTLILPNFISWVLVAYIGFALFSHQNGIFNSIIEAFGGERIMWYAEPKYWPVILTVFEMWKNVGMGCIVYYAALMGLDESLFEAARIDGANKFQQIVRISIPSILPIICVMLIMALGGVMGGDLGLFYQLPMDSGALYPVTDVMATYQQRGLQAGNYGQTAAVGLFQSLVGLVLVITTNTVVKKLNPDNAMF